MNYTKIKQRNVHSPLESWFMQWANVRHECLITTMCGWQNALPGRGGVTRLARAALWSPHELDARLSVFLSWHTARLGRFGSFWWVKPGPVVRTGEDQPVWVTEGDSHVELKVLWSVCDSDFHSAELSNKSPYIRRISLKSCITVMFETETTSKWLKLCCRTQSTMSLDF